LPAWRDRSSGAAAERAVRLGARAVGLRAEFTLVDRARGQHRLRAVETQVVAAGVAILRARAVGIPNGELVVAEAVRAAAVVERTQEQAFERGSQCIGQLAAIEPPTALAVRRRSGVRPPRIEEPLVAEGNANAGLEPHVVAGRAARRRRVRIDA